MLNNPKNIAEYVAQYIIKENKYRDDEIQRLQKVFKEFGIIECKKCKEYSYSNHLENCDLCDDINCYKCSTIKHYHSWNLSGINMCEKCSLIYCQYCLNNKEYNNKYCKECVKN